MRSRSFLYKNFKQQLFLPLCTKTGLIFPTANPQKDNLKWLMKKSWVLLEFYHSTISNGQSQPFYDESLVNRIGGDDLVNTFHEVWVVVGVGSRPSWRVKGEKFFDWIIYIQLKKVSFTWRKDLNFTLDIMTYQLSPCVWTWKERYL